MNLENLNLIELNAQEIQETEGGFLPLLILAVVAVCSSSCVPCPAQK
jgi:hypothetical protein